MAVLPNPSKRYWASAHDRPPKVAVIGGGTGSYTVLRGLRDYRLDLAAVVSMMDSGGSSGRLRDDFGLLPPGDLRRCLLALSADDAADMTLRKLFEYRFERGEGLNGHNFGNLFLTALTEICGGLEGAIEAANHILQVRGAVIPVTLDDVHLCAELADGAIIRGESAIDVRVERPDVPIRKVFLDSPACPNPRAIKAIAEAEMVVMGPGDLYTSLIPNLLISGIPEAVCASPAMKVLVCNVMTKRGETDGFRASDFASEVCRYLRLSRLDWVLVHSGEFAPDLERRYAAEGAYPVAADTARLAEYSNRIVQGDFLSTGGFARHDSGLLAAELIRILEFSASDSSHALELPLAKAGLTVHA